MIGVFTRRSSSDYGINYWSIKLKLKSLYLSILLKTGCLLQLTLAERKQSIFESKLIRTCYRE